MERVCVCAQSLGHVRLFGTPWAAAHQAPVSMEVSRQEYWSGLLFPPPGDLPHPGIKPGSPALQADSSLLSHPGSPQFFVEIGNYVAPFYFPPIPE